jgi:hypothetical protein
VRNRLWLHWAIAAVWTASAVPAFLWWKESILFVIAASVFANVYAAISAAEAVDDSAVLAKLDEIERLLKTDPDV